MKPSTLALGLLIAATGTPAAAAAPGVMIAELPAIIGAINEELVVHTLYDHREDFEACYVSALADAPELSGAVTVRFIIGDQGEVASAEVRTSTLGDDEVESCILETFDFMNFPQPYRGRPYAIYRMSFQPMR